MKQFIIGLIVGLTVYACSGMGQRSHRLRTDMDASKTPWDFCTPAMATEYKGFMCLVECETKLKKDGSCKDNKYKYPKKELKTNHHFFMDKFIAVPENEFY